MDRERARFSSWYELFPRSTSPDPGRHGTFRDVERLLPEIAAMGFDMLYMPPDPPIGMAFRKGPEQLVQAGQAMKEVRGLSVRHRRGHKAIHAALGTFEDFDHLVKLSSNMVWNLRWISRSSARPTIHGLKNIPTGLSTGLTERSNMRRTRRRNTRTSTP